MKSRLSIRNDCVWMRRRFCVIVHRNTVMQLWHPGRETNRDETVHDMRRQTEPDERRNTSTAAGNPLAQSSNANTRYETAGNPLAQGSSALVLDTKHNSETKVLRTNDIQRKSEVNAIQSKLNAVEQLTKNNKPNTGVSYTRWGRTTCPHSETVVYKGFKISNIQSIALIHNTNFIRLLHISNNIYIISCCNFTTI